MLEVRRPTVDDIPEIEDIAAQYSENPLVTKFESAAVVSKYNDVVAFGVLRTGIEAILYATGDDRTKVESIKKLFEIAVSDARKLGHDSIYIFAETESFARICEKHFKFRRIKTIPLILELGE